jgi:hypothetical protein
MDCGRLGDHLRIVRNPGAIRKLANIEQCSHKVQLFETLYNESIAVSAAKRFPPDDFVASATDAGAS